MSSVLLDGLKRLEYRGYDSCGLAIMDDGSPRSSIGRPDSTPRSRRSKTPESAKGSVKCGIGHTRWATHGRPSEDNSHPHRDCTGRFYVAHNGIIENYLALKRRLIAEGHELRSETDTEVLPHLIEAYYEGDLEKAVRRALREVEGVYGIVVVSTEGDGRRIVAARNGPPIVVGMGSGENFVASDVPALLPYTREMIFLKDGEIAVIGAMASRSGTPTATVHVPGARNDYVDRGHGRKRRLCALHAERNSRAASRHPRHVDRADPG